jgi:hypothetical protein
MYSGTARDRAYRQLLDELLELREHDPRNAAALVERLSQAIQDELGLPAAIWRHGLT